MLADSPLAFTPLAMFDENETPTPNQRSWVNICPDESDWTKIDAEDQPTILCGNK